MTRFNAKAPRIDIQTEPKRMISITLEMDSLEDVHCTLPPPYDGYAFLRNARIQASDGGEKNRTPPLPFSAPALPPPLMCPLLLLLRPLLLLLCVTSPPSPTPGRAAHEAAGDLHLPCARFSSPSSRSRCGLPRLSFFCMTFYSKNAKILTFQLILSRILPVTSPSSV